MLRPAAQQSVMRKRNVKYTELDSAGGDAGDAGHEMHAVSAGSDAGGGSDAEDAAGSHLLLSASADGTAPLDPTLIPGLDDLVWSSSSDEEDDQGRRRRRFRIEEDAFMALTLPALIIAMLKLLTLQIRWPGLPVVAVLAGVLVVMVQIFQLDPDIDNTVYDSFRPLHMRWSWTPGLSLIAAYWSVAASAVLIGAASTAIMMVNVLQQIIATIAFMYWWRERRSSFKRRRRHTLRQLNVVHAVPGE